MASGPLAKPYGLCHGTAGNGYGFLKIFDRTQDERWLDRARAFAMHALAQAEAAVATHGRYRFELLTGDLGLTHYLYGCLEADSAWPLIDEV